MYTIQNLINGNLKTTNSFYELLEMVKDYIYKQIPITINFM